MVVINRLQDLNTSSDDRNLAIRSLDKIHSVSLYNRFSEPVIKLRKESSRSFSRSMNNSFKIQSRDTFYTSARSEKESEVKSTLSKDRDSSGSGDFERTGTERIDEMRARQRVARILNLKDRGVYKDGENVIKSSFYGNNIKLHTNQFKLDLV